MVHFSGMGAVVGFVKVGHKRLFIYDQNGLNHEMEPLCTLDFYVHESRQRMGCGHRLFEYMLHVRQDSYGNTERNSSCHTQRF